MLLIWCYLIWCYLILVLLDLVLLDSVMLDSVMLDLVLLALLLAVCPNAAVLSLLAFRRNNNCLHCTFWARRDRTAVHFLYSVCL